MDAYQRLTQDLPQRASGDRPRRGGAKAAREAIAGLPLANPLQAAREVEQLLDGMLASAWDGCERVAALAQLRGPVAELCRGIEQQLSGESHPLPPAGAERAALAQRLEWKLACGCAVGVHELCAPAGKLPMFKARVVADAIVTGLVHGAQALVWAYRQYQAPPAGAWHLLHALHAFACEAALADRPAGDARSEGGPLTARSAYVQALVLALANPYRLSARGLRETCAVVACVADRCVLARGGEGVRIDPDSDAGPGPVTEEQPAADPGALVLDVQPAAQVLNERLAQLPEGVDALELPRPGGAAVATGAAFLRRLMAGWTSTARAHARLPASHVLDAVVGMHALHYALAGNVDFATFIRELHGEAITVGQHELAGTWLAGGDAARPEPFRGEVLDQSEGGYRLRLQDPDGARLRIGEVIGLAPVVGGGDELEPREWMVGVIRWLRLGDGHAWLGVELLHRAARAVGLRPVTSEGETLVPQRAVELPGQGGEGGLAVLLTHHLAGNITGAEIALPALASDWNAHAEFGVWRCDGSETLGAACVRVHLVRDDAGAGSPSRPRATAGAA